MDEYLIGLIGNLEEGPIGPGDWLPSGGNSGDVLRKNSDADYDAGWYAASSQPTADAVALFDANGNLKSGTPVEDEDVVTLAVLHQTEQEIGDAVAGLRTSIAKNAPAIVDTASGTIASFDDGADGVPVKKLIVNIEAVQSGSGDPSPDNVRPISGWTGATISHSGADTSAPATLPISWETEASTVYGGTLDVTTGLLTVDRVCIALSGDESFTSVPDPGRRFTLRLQTEPANDPAQIFRDGLVSHGLLTNSSSGGWGYFRVYATGYLGIFDPDQIFPDTEALKAYLREQSAAGTPLQVVYPIKTPQTYQLTPQQIDTLLGINNIWADTGEVSVDYVADTKLYIEKLTQPTEDDMTADHLITSGTFFMVGNSLYLATAQIAAGATITPGTNATKLSLADALNTLKS